MRVTIQDARKLAKERELSHVIIFAFDKDKVQHVATYGKTLEQCSQAAEFGNNLKTILKWPESLQAQPSRVKRLLEKVREQEIRIAVLRKKYEKSRPYCSEVRRVD